MFYSGQQFTPRGRGGQIQSTPPPPRLPNSDRGTGKRPRGSRGGRGGRGGHIPTTTPEIR